MVSSILSVFLSMSSKLRIFLETLRVPRLLYRSTTSGGVIAWMDPVHVSFFVLFHVAVVFLAPRNEALEGSVFQGLHSWNISPVQSCTSTTTPQNDPEIAAEKRFQGR
jgi:hypothetical protein